MKGGFVMKEAIVRFFRMRGMGRLGAVIFAVVIAAAMCIGPGDSNVLAKEKIWKLKIQTYTVPHKWDSQWAGPLKFTELLRKHTKGRLDCSVHPAGELVGPREIWTSVSSGTLDTGVTLSIYQGGTHPEFSFDLGWDNTNEEFFELMHAGVLDIYNKLLQRENIRIIGYLPMSQHSAFAMKKGFLKTFDDLKGKKLRSMGPVGSLFLKYAGAGTVTLPMSEVPAALQTGVADGIHTGLTGVYAMHVWDIAPYFTTTKHGCMDIFLLMNGDVYRDLPKDIKAGIDAAQRDLEQWFLQYDKNMREVVVEDTEKKGVKWYFLPPKEEERFREFFSKATVTWVMERTPDLGKKLYGIMEKVTGRKILK
jgi:TRAP-type C4-dicarboxylate transport system substrate-binding protein